MLNAEVDITFWEILKGFLLLLLTVLNGIVVPMVIKLLKTTEVIKKEANEMKDELVRQAKLSGFEEGVKEQKRKSGLH